jgi:glycosyltransferase involved in cell wall biosynthesis
MDIEITIITPVLNSAGYIERCVRNVAAQNCNFIEHLVIDGGSTDGTKDILMRLASEFHWLRFMSIKGISQSEAMNKGALLARGRILGVLNSDDYYEPDIFVRILSLFRQNPNVHVFVGACNIRSDSGKLIYVNRPRRLFANAFLFGFEFPVNPSAYFYRAHIHKLIGGFDEKDHYSMDLDFLYRVVRRCNARYINEVWGNFVIRSGAKTSVDKAAGCDRVRKKKLYQRYLEQLPWSQKVCVLSARPFVIFARKIINTIKRPGETIERYTKLLCQVLRPGSSCGEGRG